MEIMKNKDVLFYEVALDDVKLKGLDLTTLISRNKEMAAEEAKHLRAGIEQPEVIKEYRNKLQALQEKYAKKNAEGNVIMKVVSVGGQEVEMPDIESFNDSDGPYAKEYAKLRADNSEDLTKYEALVNEFKSRLDDENENFKPILINYEYVPKDIDSDDMNIIWGLIDKKTIPEHLK
jgi:hypothetical protein